MSAQDPAERVMSQKAAQWSVALVVQNFPVLSEAFVSTLAESLQQRVGALSILATANEATPPPHHPAVGRADLLRKLQLSRRKGTMDWARLLELCRDQPGKAAGLIALGLFDAVAPAERTAFSRMLIEQPPFDVVHCQFGYEGLAVLRHLNLGTLRTRAFICHLRGSDVTRHVRENGEHVYATMFARADLLIANCEFFRQRAIELGARPDGVVVVGSPIDTDRFAPPPAGRPAFVDRPFRLVAVGRLVEKKGFADVIAAIQLLDDLPVTVDIYGDGPLRAALERQARDGGISHRVAFHGPSTSDQILRALHSADAALAPSVTAVDGDSDAPTNTIKEAMSTGLPVIASDHGGIPELVKSGQMGYLVPERSPEELASAIRRLHDEPERWAAMGERGRSAVVARYALEEVTNRTLEAYDTALARGARHDR